MTFDAQTMLKTRRTAPAHRALRGTNRPMVHNRSKPENSAQRDAAWMLAVSESRDVRALEALFTAYGPSLKGWLMARGAGSGNAEDVVQDVMIKVWTRASTFDSTKASFATWVYRMTRNRWIDHQRKHGRVDVRDPELMKTLADDEVPSAEDTFAQTEQSEHLRVLVARLPDAQRAVIHMAFMEHKTHQEISDQTGIPLGTVKTRIRAAIQNLKSHMEKTPL